nr:lysine-rich arabinogalactan protein 19-like [Aegilops tauschii subsp. strangulata]
MCPSRGSSAARRRSPLGPGRALPARTPPLPRGSPSAAPRAVSLRRCPDAASSPPFPTSPPLVPAPGELPAAPPSFAPRPNSGASPVRSPPPSPVSSPLRPVDVVPYGLPIVVGVGREFGFGPTHDPNLDEDERQV